MRILLSTDAVGGVWDHAATHVRQLVADGHEVTVAVVGELPAGRTDDLGSAVRVDQLPVPLEWMPGGVERCSEAARWLDRLAGEVDAEVVHLNQLTYAPGVSRPTVVAVHGDVWSWFHEVKGSAPEDPRWLAYRKAVARGVASADVVVAPSRYQSELTARCYGRRADHVVWNGVDAPPESAAAGDRPRPAESARAILSIGRAWDDAKGMDVLERALERLDRCAPLDGWTAWVAGDTEGPDGQRFEAARVASLGRVPKREVWALLGHAGVYVGASRYEPFGLAVAEAALAGCALVLSDIGSFREIWEDAALFFPKGDASALAAALERLRSEPDEARRLASLARSRARSVLGAPRMTRAYVEIYQALRAATAFAATSAPLKRQGGTCD